MKLKTYTDFAEKKLIEALGQADRGMASNMTGDQAELQQLAGRVNMSQYITRIGSMLTKLEKALGVNNNSDAGENAHQWHDQAVQLLNHALRMAATGGKKQWNAAMQLKRWKKQQASAAPVTPAAPQASAGPTPLNAA